MEDDARTIYSKLHDPAYYGERLVHAIANDEQLINRMGRFKISRDTITTEPESVARILGSTIVLRAEMLIAYDSIMYDAISPLFDIREPGSQLPEYIFEIEVGEHNSVQSIKARKL